MIADGRSSVPFDLDLSLDVSCVGNRVVAGAPSGFATTSIVDAATGRRLLVARHEYVLLDTSGAVVRCEPGIGALSSAGDVHCKEGGRVDFGFSGMWSCLEFNRGALVVETIGPQIQYRVLRFDRDYAKQASALVGIADMP